MLPFFPRGSLFPLPTAGGRRGSSVPDGMIGEWAPPSRRSQSAPMNFRLIRYQACLPRCSAVFKHPPSGRQQSPALACTCSLPDGAVLITRTACRRCRYRHTGPPLEVRPGCGDGNELGKSGNLHVLVINLPKFGRGRNGTETFKTLSRLSFTSPILPHQYGSCGQFCRFLLKPGLPPCM